MGIEKIFNQLDIIKISKYKNKLRLYQRAIGRLYSTQNMLEEKITILKRKLAESKKVKIYSRLINDNNILKLEVSSNNRYDNAITILSISENRVFNYLNKEFIELLSISKCDFEHYDENKISVYYSDIDTTVKYYLVQSIYSELRLTYEIENNHKYILEFSNQIELFSSSQMYYSSDCYDSKTIFTHGESNKIVYEPDKKTVEEENEKVKAIIKGINNGNDTEDTE